MIPEPEVVSVQHHTIRADDRSWEIVSSPISIPAALGPHLEKMPGETESLCSNYTGNEIFLFSAYSNHNKNVCVLLVQPDLALAWELAGGHMLRELPLKHFAELCGGGLAYTDRGQGTAGPAWYCDEPGQLTEDDADQAVTLVTEAEDPDAWARAREAFRLLDLPYLPTAIALGKPCEDHRDNPHQAIFAG